MVHESKVLHHLHVIKGVHLKKQKYSHPDKKIKSLDDLVLIASVIIPLATLPQVLKIWVEKNASGVSVWTWGVYLILSFSMLVYGMVHKEKVIVLMYILWILIHISVITGILFYG